MCTVLYGGSDLAKTPTYLVTRLPTKLYLSFHVVPTAVYLLDYTYCTCTNHSHHYAVQARHRLELVSRDGSLGLVLLTSVKGKILCVVVGLLEERCTKVFFWKREFTPQAWERRE